MSSARLVRSHLIRPPARQCACSVSAARLTSSLTSRATCRPASLLARPAALARVIYWQRRVQFHIVTSSDRPLGGAASGAFGSGLLAPSGRNEGPSEASFFQTCARKPAPLAPVGRPPVRPAASRAFPIPRGPAPLHSVQRPSRVARATMTSRPGSSCECQHAYSHVSAPQHGVVSSRRRTSSAPETLDDKRTRRRRRQASQSVSQIAIAGGKCGRSSRLCVRLAKKVEAPLLAIIEFERGKRVWAAAAEAAV